MLTRITLIDERCVNMTAKKQHCRISAVKREGPSAKDLRITAMVVDAKYFFFFKTSPEDRST